jgi:G:T-mismatch repair DNA endonuclease (very short patch repair protein)
MKEKGYKKACAWTELLCAVTSMLSYTHGCLNHSDRPVRLAYRPPANGTFLLEQISTNH